jgi:hypothetical protein
MENRLVKTLDLDNGATLKFFDNSRKVAGDRWLVALLVRFEAPVEKILSDIDDTLPVPPYRIVKAIGETVVHEKTDQRNFVDEETKDEVWDELKAAFIENALPYLSESKFPLKLILKEYADSAQTSEQNSGASDAAEME